MKKYICPHCHNKQIDNDICHICLGDMNTIEDYPYLKRQLKISLILNDTDQIKQIAKQIIDIDDKNIYAQYAYAYGMLNNDLSLINAFLDQVVIDDRITSHMLSHIEYFPKDLVSEYIKKQYGEKRANEIMLTNYEISIPEQLYIDFNLRSKSSLDENLKTSLLFLGIGIVSLILVTVFGVLWLSSETRYFGTVLYYFIPSLFIGTSITRILLKKGNKFLTVIFGLIFLILITYLVLLPQSSNFINHIGRVLLAPVEAVDYYAMRAVK